MAPANGRILAVELLLCLIHLVLRDFYESGHLDASRILNFIAYGDMIAF